MKILALLVFALANVTGLYAQKSFGFTYNNDGKQTFVLTVFKNGPAAKAGMQTGDIIVSINSNDLTGLNLDAVAKLFSAATDISTMSLLRNGTAINKLKISRADRSSFLNVCVSGDCQNGIGEFIDLDGYQYNDSFKNGVKTGNGKMAYFDNKVYTGNWANNKPEGKGKDVLKNGDTYEGIFANGLYHGEGIYSTKNGDTYAGIYKNGRFDGTVKHYIKSSNENYTEIYKDGVFVSSKKEEVVTSKGALTVKNTEEALQKLNKYLSSFNNGYYGNVEIKDGYWYTKFKAGEYCKAKMSDLGEAVVKLDANSVILKCKENSECVFSTWNNGYNEYSQFRTTVNFDKEELAKLLNNVLDSYNNENAGKQLTFNGGEKYDKATNPAPNTSNAPSTSVSSGSDEIQELIEVFKAESIKKGATLVDYGVYKNSGSYNRTINVEANKTYIIIAATNYDPNTFGFYLTYNDRFPVLETNDWDDNDYKISAGAEYAMKAQTSKVGNLSVRRMNFSPTKSSSVRNIQLITTGTKGKIQWICFQMK